MDVHPPRGSLTASGAISREGLLPGGGYPRR